MTNSISWGLDFYIENRGVILLVLDSDSFVLFCLDVPCIFSDFFTILPIKSSILMLRAPKLSLRWRTWIESEKNLEDENLSKFWSKLTKFRQKNAIFYKTAIYSQLHFAL